MAQYPLIALGGQKKKNLNLSPGHGLIRQSCCTGLGLDFRKTWGNYVLAACTYARSAESLGRPEHVLQATRAYSALPAGHIISANAPAEDLCLQKAMDPSECVSFFPQKPVSTSNDQRCGFFLHLLHKRSSFLGVFLQKMKCTSLAQGAVLVEIEC